MLQESIIEVVNEVRHIFNEILVLPLLPAKNIKHGVDSLRESTSVLIYPNIASVKAVIKKIEAILQYIDTYWLTDWSPDDISVNKDKNRTNNDLESYHSGLIKLFLKNPSPTKFLRMKYFE